MITANPASPQKVPKAPPTSPQKSGSNKNNNTTRKLLIAGAIIIVIILLILLVAELVVLLNKNSESKQNITNVVATKVNAIVFGKYQFYNYTVEGNEQLGDGVVLTGGTNNALFFTPNDEQLSQSLTSNEITLPINHGILLTYTFVNNAPENDKKMKVSIQDNSLKVNTITTYATTVSNLNDKSMIESINLSSLGNVIISPQQQATIYVYITADDNLVDASYVSNATNGLTFTLETVENS